MSRLYLFVLVLFATTAFAQPQQAQIIPLPDTSGQYHWGDDPRCATLSGEGCTLESSTGDNFPPSPILWTRFVVHLPGPLSTPQQLGLLVEGAPCVYEVFVNGHLIGSRGNLQTLQGPYNSRAVFPFSSNLAQNGVLAISLRANVFADNMENNLKPAFPAAVGPLESVEVRLGGNTAAHLRAQWQHYLCFLLVFCIGLFFLLLYALDRSLAEYLWLALFLCGISSFRFLELGSVANARISSLPANFLGVFASILATFSVVQFSFSLIQRRVWMFFRFVQIIAAVDLLELAFYVPLSPAALLHLLHLGPVVGPTVLISNALSTLACVVPLRFCFKNPLPEMRWVGGALMFLFFEDINHYLIQLRTQGLLHISTVPRDVAIGDLVLDIRALAYLLFALVMLIAMTVRFRRLQTRNRQVELDLDAARTVQRLLIPAQAPATPGFSIESVYIPAQEVGGDFFHVAPATDGSVLVVMGDVSGKGLSAAMTVSTIIGALRTISAREPSEVLLQINLVLHGFVSGFATCCVALLTPEGHLTLANAGHLNPYRNGTELPVSGSLPLGLSADVTYTSEHFTLDPGDHLTFISDGVVESTGLKGELFGFERTAALSRGSAQSIARAAQSFGAGAQTDDITVLTLDCGHRDIMPLTPAISGST